MSFTLVLNTIVAFGGVVGAFGMAVLIGSAVAVGLGDPSALSRPPDPATLGPVPSPAQPNG